MSYYMLYDTGRKRYFLAHLFKSVLQAEEFKEAVIRDYIFLPKNKKAANKRYRKDVQVVKVRIERCHGN